MQLQNVEQRDASPDDFDFLYRLHEETLRPYVGNAEAWQLENFKKHFSVENQRVLQWSGTDIGSISLVDSGDFLVLDNIALLPEYRGRRVGRMLIEDTLGVAARRGIPVRLNVLKVNPAWKLYRKLGFRVTNEDHHRYFMEATPHRLRVSEEGHS
jgi:ribosomal protein S18 acetylase RimI-like enzyme